MWETHPIPKVDNTLHSYREQQCSWNWMQIVEFGKSRWMRNPICWQHLMAGIPLINFHSEFYSAPEVFQSGVPNWWHCSFGQRLSRARLMTIPGAEVIGVCQCHTQPKEMQVPKTTVGHIIDREGVRADPSKTKAISIGWKLQVQCLTWEGFLA